MPSLPIDRDVKEKRCAAWRKATEARVLQELAQKTIELLGTSLLGVERSDPKKLFNQFSSYRRIAQPVLPKLEACVAIEYLQGLAKGQVYLAITQSEKKRLATLVEKFGELPLRYDPQAAQYYETRGNTPPEESDQPMTLDRFAHILKARNIPSTSLAKVIGRKDIAWQKLAQLRGEGKKGSTSPLPQDIQEDVIKGLKKLAESTEPLRHTPPPASLEKREQQVPSDELHIVGLGGLDISITTQINLQNLRLEDNDGNALVQGGILHIPSLPLSEQQREIIRKWIAETVAKRMV